jgi:sugar phosphate isomerase/epimerase
VKIGMRIPGKIGALGLEAVAVFAKEIGLDAVDIGSPDAQAKAAIENAGLQVGSVDIMGLANLLTRDEAKRNEALAQAKEDLDKMAQLGLTTVFTCLIPPEKGLSRRESFAIFKDAFPEVVAYAEAKGVQIAIEPYPGPAPHYPTLGCTPEMYRAIFEAIPSPALGICYDPSHFVRMGIDYLRVLTEFGHRVRHVHGKDTEILNEGCYLYGYHGPTFPTDLGWAGGYWRYTIPGSGEVNWAKVVAHLRINGYDGIISIELEDHVYGYTLEAQKQGIINAQRHLRSVI